MTRHFVDPIFSTLTTDGNSGAVSQSEMMYIQCLTSAVIKRILADISRAFTLGQSENVSIIIRRNASLYRSGYRFDPTGLKRHQAAYRGLPSLSQSHLQIANIVKTLDPIKKNNSRYSINNYSDLMTTQHPKQTLQLKNANYFPH